MRDQQRLNCSRRVIVCDVCGRREEWTIHTIDQGLGSLASRYAWAQLPAVATFAGPDVVDVCGAECARVQGERLILAALTPPLAQL